MISKKETFELMTIISDFYEHFEITQSKIDSWHSALKDCEFEKLKENLLLYSRENKFPPKIADLIKEKPKTLDRMNAIPNADETLSYLYSQKNREYTDEEKLNIERHKAEIRKILGIGKQNE